MAQNSSEASDGGGRRVDVIPSLLAGEVTDMQGSWVGGPAKATGQGSQRSLGLQVGTGRREEAVSDRRDR